MSLNVTWGDMRPKEGPTANGEYSIEFTNGSSAAFSEELKLLGSLQQIDEDTEVALNTLNKGAVQNWNQTQASNLWSFIPQAEVNFNKAQKNYHESPRDSVAGEYAVTIKPKYGLGETIQSGGTPQLSPSDNAAALAKAQSQVKEKVKEVAPKVGFGIGAILALVLVVVVAGRGK